MALPFVYENGPGRRPDPKQVKFTYAGEMINPETSNKKMEKVKLENTGEIELPQVDLAPYVGKKAAIEDVEELKGNYGYFIRVVTGTVATLDIKDKDGKPIELKGSRIFGLQESDEGQIGWGEKTKLGQFLKKMGVDHYNDLVGEEVVIQTITNKADGKDYLTFN